jgi:hypothetical protein
MLFHFSGARSTDSGNFLAESLPFTRFTVIIAFQYVFTGENASAAPISDVIESNSA